MKILSKEEKKLKKAEYKNTYKPENIDNADFAIYALNMPVKKYGKRIKNYLYHYRRLYYKRYFLEKRIENLDAIATAVLLQNEEYFEIMRKTLDFKGMDETKDKAWELNDNKQASDMMVAAAIENFYRSILEFSTLIKQLSNILDAIDPKNKDKFKYSKTKDFFMGLREIYLNIKIMLREFAATR